MRFKESSNPVVVAFYTLSAGVVFKTKGVDGYCMKTEEVTDDYRNIVNAVQLSNGNMLCLNDSDAVHVVDCELIIY